MNYIVLDLEWNQSSEGRERENKDFPFEIIEIGAVKLNRKKEIIGEFHELIQPQVYQEMNHITERIVHVQMRELKNGRPFMNVMKDFLRWCGRDSIFATWGPLDLLELQRNMRYYQMKPLSKGPIKFLDVQKLFSLAYEDGKLRRTLEYSIDNLQIEKVIPFHRAYSDAFYTAKVFQTIQNPQIEKNFSYDLFTIPRTKREEIFVLFPNYAKYISREFASKTEAIEDREVISTKCYKCHRNTTVEIRWFSTNGKHYYSVSRCKKHGYMKGKIRIKKSEGEKVYVVKTMKFISLEEIQEIEGKKIKTLEQRKQKRQHRN